MSVTICLTLASLFLYARRAWNAKITSNYVNKLTLPPYLVFAAGNFGGTIYFIILLINIDLVEYDGYYIVPKTETSIYFWLAFEQTTSYLLQLAIMLIVLEWCLQILYINF